MKEDTPYLQRVGARVNKYNSLKLTKDQVIIGRSRRATFTLSSNVISRWHAVISRLGGDKWSIIDANSLNGIHVNGHQLRPFVPYILQEGDVVQFAVSDCNKAEFEYTFCVTSQKQLKRQSEEIVQDMQLENEAQLNENNQAVLFGSHVDLTFTKERQIPGRNYLDPALLMRKLNAIQVECALIKLQPLETEDDVITDIVKFMNRELQCPICKQLLVQAATLNCSHTFCKVCITQCMHVKDECPDCHTYITSLTRVVALDNCMDTTISQLSGRAKQQGADVISVTQSAQDLFDGTVANPSPAVREKRKEEVRRPLTRAGASHRLATLKSAASRRAAVVDSEALTKTFTLIRAAELTRLAALRKTRAAVRSAPMIKATKVAKTAVLKRKSVSRKTAVGIRKVQDVSRTATKTASINISTAEFIPFTAPAVNTAAPEKTASEHTVDRTAASNSKHDSSSSKSGSEEEMSDSSLSGSAKGSSDSNVSSEASGFSDSDDSPDDDEDNESKLRKGSGLSLNDDDVAPVADDHKDG